MLQGLVSSAEEAAALYQVMPLVECRGCEIIVDRVDAEVAKGVDGRYGVLPDVTNDVENALDVEEVNWRGRHPVLEVDVADRFVIPGEYVLLKQRPDAVVLILGRQSDIPLLLLRLPTTEGSRLQVVDLHWPVPGHLYKPANCS